MVEDIKTAFELEWFWPFMVMTSLVTYAVGKEMRWLEGSYLTDQQGDDEVGVSPAMAKRQRTRKDDSTIDPWAGKRLPSLAMGWHKDACDRIKHCASVKFNALLLDLEASLSAAIMSEKTAICHRIAVEIDGKLDYYLHIPHKVCGAFSQYCGYSREESKKCLDECFSEYQAIDDPSKADFLSRELLGGANAVSKQLDAARRTPTTDLHNYPEAFVTIQEYSLGSSVGRFVEQMHVRTKIAQTRGLVTSKPASTCARQRSQQVLDDLADVKAKDWYIEHWHSRTLFQELLEHFDENVNDLSVYERHARVYRYRVEDTHLDIAEEEQQCEAIDSYKKKHQQQRALALVPSDLLCIDYLKSVCRVGVVFSVSTDLADFVMDGADYSPGGLTHGDLVCAVTPSAHVAPVSLSASVFMHVVNPRPENQVQLSKAHIAKERTLMCVSVLQHKGPADAVLLDMQSARQVMIDLAGWCGEHFLAVVKDLKMWTVQPCGMEVQAVPAVGCVSLKARHLQPKVILDSDPVSDIIHAGLEIVPAAAGSVGAPAVRAQGITDGMRDMLQALVQAKAFSECDSFISVMDIDANIATVAELVALGLITVRDDGFGTDEYAMNLASVRLSATLRLTNPAALAEIDPRRAKYNSYSKLELVNYLVRLQHKPDNSIHFLAADAAELTFRPEMLSRSKLYFVSLALKPIIFGKGLRKMFQCGSENYYKCLIHLQDLSQIAALTDADVRKKPDKYWKDMLGNQSVSTDVPLEDGAPPVIGEPMPLAAHSILLDEAAIQVDAVTCKCHGMPPYKVNFDRFTHQSGNLRCTINCNEHDGNCRRYIFVKDYPSREHAIAFLMAWRHEARLYPDRAQRLDHIKHDPSPELVSALMHEQFV